MSRLSNYGRFWLAFLILSQTVLSAATPEAGADRLRKLLKLPTISLESGFSLNSEEGFSIAQSNAGAPKEISEIRKQLKGDTSDAESYGRLAELYAKTDAKKADECSQKAAILFRQQTATRPDDPRLLADFGRALWTAGKIDEADSVLRRAVQIDPGRAISWQTLGHFLEAEAKRALISGDGTSRKKLSPEKLLIEVSRVKPRAEQVAQSRKFAEEASTCFDRAVAVSTNSSDAYLQRALHKSFDGYLQNVLAYVQGEKTDLTEVMKGMFNIDCLPDFQQAAQLSSTEYRTLAMSAFFEAFAMNIQSNPSQGTLGAWNQLPDRSQKSIRSALTRLENLGQEPDTHLAAGAMESLSILQGFVVGDRIGAERSARRAVALDPTREQSWDMLIGLLAKPDTYDELRSVCEQRVRQKETARNRILLAKADERLNQLARAEENVQTALKLEPNDFTANLAEAALLMKRRRDAGGLTGASRYLGKAEQILKKENKENDPRYVQVALLSSIYYALRGDMDKARELIRGVLDSDKNNSDAREILSALSW